MAAAAHQEIEHTVTGAWRAEAAAAAAAAAAPAPAAAVSAPPAAPPVVAGVAPPADAATAADSSSRGEETYAANADAHAAVAAAAAAGAPLAAPPVDEVVCRAQDIHSRPEERDTAAARCESASDNRSVRGYYLREYGPKTILSGPGRPTVSGWPRVAGERPEALRKHQAPGNAGPVLRAQSSLAVRC